MKGCALLRINELTGTTWQTNFAVYFMHGDMFIYTTCMAFLWLIWSAGIYLTWAETEAEATTTAHMVRAVCARA